MPIDTNPGAPRISIVEGPAAVLPEYAGVPIAFEVASVFDVASIGSARAEADRSRPRFALTERRLERPYVKDYDTVAGDAPAAWPERFDLSRWRFFVARADSWPVGAAAVAFDTPEVEMLEGRRDLAVLWDIRVAPGARGHGLGRSLFRAAEEWALAKGCRELKVETQNVNVPACRFYERMGCRLGAAHRAAYPDLPHEIQLLWYKELTRANGAARS